MQKFIVILILGCILGSVSAFRPIAAGRFQVSRRHAIDESGGDDDFEDPKLFDMNKRVRLGRSRDQDGKSNIWSIEPRMEVEGEGAEAEEGSGLKKNLFIVGAVIGAAIVSLPLFQAFSSLVPDPSDF